MTSYQWIKETTDYCQYCFHKEEAQRIIFFTMCPVISCILNLSMLCGTCAARRHLVILGISHLTSYEHKNFLSKGRTQMRSSHSYGKYFVYLFNILAIKSHSCQLVLTSCTFGSTNSTKTLTNNTFLPTSTTFVWQVRAKISLSIFFPTLVVS